MNIGFDISQTGSNKAGCGHFAYSLINTLAQMDHDNSYVLFPYFGDFFFDPLMPLTCPINKSHIKYGPRFINKQTASKYWQNADSMLQERLSNINIIHSNNFYCPQNLSKTRVVYTLHDIGFLDNPWWTTEENRLGCFYGVFSASINADLIIAVSHATRTHFLSIFPHYPGERVIVVYPASRFSDTVHVKQPKSLGHLQPEKFWLNVGTIEPRKNPIRLINAYAKLKNIQGQAFPLVLAGGQGWLMGDLDIKIKELGLSDDIVLTGYVDDQTLCWLYQNCFAHVYPSLFEGFGLPVLESMEMSAAVIASNSSSIPEITSDAAILIDPLSEDDLTNAMIKLIDQNDLWNVLKVKAKERARLFSWHNTAVQVLNAYYDCLSNDKAFI